MRPTTELPMTLSALVSILAAARHGGKAVALRTFRDLAPDAGERAAIIEHVRALDPDAGEVLAKLDAEVSS